MGDCNPGLRDQQTLKVTKKSTASSMGSGDVPVLGTPAVLALAEAACVQAIADDLPEGQTSVGTWAEVHHDKATCVGAEVVADATLVGHHGRRLEFSVIVRQDDKVVARVRHHRTLVVRDKFLEKVGAAEKVA